MSIYKGEIITSNDEKLRSIEHNKWLASYLDKLGLSGDGTIDWILVNNYDLHSGRLLNYLKLDQKVFDKRSNRWEFEHDILKDFGNDPRHWLNDYKRQVQKPRLQKMHHDLVTRVSRIEAAVMIHQECMKLS